MSAEMKSTKIVADEEAMKPATTQLNNAQPGCSKKEGGKVSMEQVKRQWSNASDDQNINEKKCTIM